MSRPLIVPIAVSLFFWAAVAASPPQDQYGGWCKLKGRKTGFFHAERIKGRWWLVTPEGNVFFSKGVCHVGLDAADRAQSVKTAAHQLRDWNFNTIGAWSDPDVYAAAIHVSVRSISLRRSTMSRSPLLAEQGQRRVKPMRSG